MAGTEFHGNSDENADLINAIARNCDCTYGLMGVRTSTCGGHMMLLMDQRALDGLLCYRHLANDLRREEFARTKGSPQQHA